MKTQLKNRLGSEATERIIRRFHNGDLSLSATQQLLGVGKSQVYNLRTQWLSSRKAVDFQGLSGGDHSKAWPPECVAHLKTLIESSIDDGPNFELYADELERKFGFKRDRTNVRRFCEANLSDLLRWTFPEPPKRSHRPLRRWACASYGELWQHDSTPRHIWGEKDDCQSILLSIDDATRKIMACRICERETLLEHFAMLEEAFLRHGPKPSTPTGSACSAPRGRISNPSSGACAARSASPTASRRPRRPRAKSNAPCGRSSTGWS